MKNNLVLILGFFVCVTSCAFAATNGWADENGGTTGGQSGTVVTVDNAADLEYYAEISTDPYIIQVSGTIDIGNNVTIRSNKTLRGLDSNATLIGDLGFQNRDSNIIIERLNITNPDGVGEGDGISIKQDISNVLITKCTIYDCTDGCLDISNRSDLVTVSWCKFYYTVDTGHNFVNLIGSSDSQTEDRGKLRVTMHHNWWTMMCKERMPRVRFGQVHVYNNYYDNDLLDGGYCIGVGVESHIRVENNYFNTVPNPWKDYYTGNGADGEIGWNEGNVFFDCSTPTWAANNYATIFTPPYSYTLDNAEQVPGIVQWGAGVDGKDGYPPHWFFSYYGDFDLSGLVDVNDFDSFVGYWLATENIDDADYDNSGRVDFGEFSLFAGNYLYIPSDTTAPEAPADLWALGQNVQVTLDWAANSDEDFDGYNVYRSITSGSGYTKQNGFLMTSSDYIDDTAANGTMYYYVVTAVDTNNNESGYSVEACAVPNATSDNITIQENGTGFCISDDIQGIENEHSGYTGSGYANTYNETGRGVDYSINSVTAGTYTFTFRYAGTTDRPADLIINGTPEIPSIAFTSTGAWDSWTTVSVPVTLTAGANSVRLQATSSDGCANIDYLKIEGAGPEIATCP